MRISQAGTWFILEALWTLFLTATAYGQVDNPPSSAFQGVLSPVRSHAVGEQTKRLPKHFADGSDLPNGWRVTPAGKVIATMGDLVTNFAVSPDGMVIVAMNSGYLPHGLSVFDTQTQKQIQRIELKSTFVGLAWSPDGRALYVSGGNASGAKNKGDPVAPIYEFTYRSGRLSETPTGKLTETIDPKLVRWSGVAYLPSKHLLYAANLGTGPDPEKPWQYGSVYEAGIVSSDVVVFDTKTGQIVTRIPVEVSPYQTVLSSDGKLLFVSNWSSESVSVINTDTNKVIRTLHVGMNPNEMKLSSDGRLFVACSNDNTVYVIDAHALRVMERLSTTLTPLAPEGSTPDALAIDNVRKLLYVANADNNSIAVVHIENRAHSAVVGFIPTGWYPSALALVDRDHTLYIGNAKGEEGHPDPLGPHSPLLSESTSLPSASSSAHQGEHVISSVGAGSVHTLQTSSIEILPVADLKGKLQSWTHQVIEDTPYTDSLLSEALPPEEPSIISREVGVPTPIQHIIYIIKENRTYDQVFGDISNANGDPKLTIFGEKITPNQHSLAKEYVVLDNLYCDGEVSVDGHSWSDAAYATDFNEKFWPPMYAGYSTFSYFFPHANIPGAGHIWDLAKRKGLTYRSYGEYGVRANIGTTDDTGGLVGHIARDYSQVIGAANRDTDKVAVFLREFTEDVAHYDSADPQKRLPNLVVMSMPEDHTMGTKPGEYTPQAMVANNDYAIGQLVDAVSHSPYWPNTAIFIIEDDAQDGPDHVDARRTVGMVISPYVKRGTVDGTLYSTSSMLRTMELLLGLPPMSQYDAAAMPMYASFGARPVVAPFHVIQPLIDVNTKNTPESYGAKASSRMDLSDVDRAPMHALNEVIWKSIKGRDSVMPPPVHRFRPLIDASESEDGDKDEKD
jgi:YVTN family beta-propeller protein